MSRWGWGWDTSRQMQNEADAELQRALWLSQQNEEEELQRALWLSRMEFEKEQTSRSGGKNVETEGMNWHAPGEVGVLSTPAAATQQVTPSRAELTWTSGGGLRSGSMRERLARKAREQAAAARAWAWDWAWAKWELDELYALNTPEPEVDRDERVREKDTW